MLYFSYGSNMSSKRISERVPSAKFVAVSTLFQHELKFHKIGKDGSAKCDARETNNPDHFVVGVVFDIHVSEKYLLDQKEGLGFGYEEKPVLLVSGTGKTIEATTYYATDINSNLKPYHWYKEHVMRGANEHGLPDTYIQNIANIVSIDDPNLTREETELIIYR